MMLIPLLGIPNIMQTIPFSPTQENITYFAIWTYLASFTYMYQGFIIAIVYCFLNREVQNVLKASYQRYRLQHSNTMELRRGSRGATVSNTSPYSRKQSKPMSTMLTMRNGSDSVERGHENAITFVGEAIASARGEKRFLVGNGTATANGSTQVIGVWASDSTLEPSV